MTLAAAGDSILSEENNLLQPSRFFLCNFLVALKKEQRFNYDAPTGDSWIPALMTTLSETILYEKD